MAQDFNTPVDDTPPPPGAFDFQPGPTPPQQPKSNKRTITIIIIVLVVLCICGVAFAAILYFWLGDIILEMLGSLPFAPAMLL